jgi:cytochrome c oxidase subunit 2
MMKYMIGAAFCLSVTLMSTFSWPDGAPASLKTIQITAKRFEYSPSEIHLKKGEPVILEFKTEDRKHGFKVPELGLVAVVVPGEVTRLPMTPDKTGRFEFHCHLFCGSGHEGMTGVIIVE